MKVFKDPDFKEELNELNLGRVDAGFSKEFTFYLLNESGAKLENIKFLINHPEISLVKVPSTMNESGKDTLILKWSPTITLKEALKTNFTIEQEELYEPK